MHIAKQFFLNSLLKNNFFNAKYENIEIEVEKNERSLKYENEVEKWSLKYENEVFQKISELFSRKSFHKIYEIYLNQRDSLKIRNIVRNLFIIFYHFYYHK